MEIINIYTVTAFTLFLFSLIVFKSNKEDKNVALLLKISIAWLIFYEGFRWEIGTDWSYCDEFRYGYDSDQIHIEIGYVFLNSILRFFTSNYTVFLVLITSFFYLVIYKISKKYSVLPLASLCIYYCTMLGYLGCNRQFLAMMICLLSIKYVIERKPVLFTAFVIVASLFHITSLLFLVVYLICNNKIPIMAWVLVIAVALILGGTDIVEKIPFAQYVALLDAGSAEKMEHYLNHEGDVYSIIGTFKRLLIIAPCLFFLKKKDTSVEMSIFMKLYILGALMYFVFNGSILELLGGRGAMYFNISEIIIIPYIIKNVFKSIPLQKCIWACYFIILVYLMLRDMNYHTSAGNLIYLPYKNVFF